MVIKFFGTGAADWKFKTPEEQISGFYRRATCQLIDGKILVDISPQSFAFAQKQKVDFAEISDVIISHTHADHFSKQALLDFSRQSKNKLRIWCHKKAVERLCLDKDEVGNFEICPIEHEAVFSVCGYTVTALAANHLVENSPETPLHYVFEKDGKCFFYGLDGGWFTASTWEYMRLKKLCFDGMILDATVGENDGDFRLGTHNSLPMLRIIIASLRANGMVSDSTRLIASHLARTLHFEEFEKVKAQFEALGMCVACDADTFEI